MAPEPTRPAYAPTQASGPVPQAYAPTQGPVGGPHHPGYGAPTAPAYAVPAAPAPAPAPARRSRVPLVVGAGVLVVALAAGGAWYFTSKDDKGGERQTAGDSKDKTAEAPKDAAPKDAAAAQGGGSTPAPQASGRTYTAVFKDKPVKFLAPREFGKVNAVDLDFPKVAPFGDIGYNDRELAMGYDSVERDPVRQEQGPHPEQCETGAATDPIPDKLPQSDLGGADSAIVQGDLLCSVTSKGNLAMVKIVGVEPSTDRLYKVPTYLTEVTLWKR